VDETTPESPEPSPEENGGGNTFM
jgi:hypothetical protein